MAIVKANYTKSNVNIKASIRYIQHRKGKDGQKVTRSLFGIDGIMERKEAYSMIDEVPKGTNFFRFVISPDPNQEDTGKDLNLREITEKTIAGLEELLQKAVPFIGAVHNDHAPHRHVHVIALVAGRLNVQEFQRLRTEATAACLEQRKELDLREQAKVQEREKVAGMKQELELSL